jgi:hypothetical protein
MKRLVILGFTLCILLVMPLILAEEQAQVYSGFNRFVDNAKLFFSSGDNKVGLALAIREKEVNSAIVNINNNNDESANNNLENAMKKLLIVQEKVSPDFADEVGDSVDKVVGVIEDSELSDSLDRYVLEEKKTQLVAELVVEVNGKEGQTLTREIVQGGEGNRKMVKVVIRNANGEIEEIEVEGEVRNDVATWEIVGQINGVDNKIGEWVVEHSYTEGTSAGGGESGVTIEGNGKGNDGLTREVKTNVAGDGTLKNESLPIPDLHKVNPALYDPNARAPGDSRDGDCGDNVVCGGKDDIIENVAGDNVIEGGETVDEGLFDDVEIVAED